MEVLEFARRKRQREELPLVLGDPGEEIAEEVLVGPFGWSAAQWQLLIREVVVDKQFCEVFNRVAAGADEGGKYAQIVVSDDTDVKVEARREGIEHTRDALFRPVLFKGTQRYVFSGIAGDIMAYAFEVRLGDELREPTELSHRGEETRCSGRR
jgi:hypothetical protein